ncbi:MAG: FecR domain-containing protein [Candidatus Aenigmarchaeota archaeon]|nr:FecR domain-containing protein [Candidatus Aenigmarchaeota archaeon]
MVRKALLIIPLIIIIAVGAFFYLQLNPLQGPLAQLKIERGTVEYSTGEEFFSEIAGPMLRFQPATDRMELKENYVVRTGTDSEASIILRESSSVRLSENTEITLEEVRAGSPMRFKARQGNGRTWHQVLKMTGFEKYEVRSPNMVATVRGTSFDMNIQDDQTTCSSADGTVLGGTDEDLRDVPEGRRLEVDSQGEFTEGELIEDEWITQNKQRDDNWLEQVKQRLREKYGFLIGTAKSQGATEEQIEEWLDGYVQGTVSVQDAIDQGLIPEQFVGLVPEELKRY